MIDDRATAVPWRAPEVVPIPGDGAVHVWHARVNALIRAHGRLREVLDRDERERADQFHFAADRACYTVAHAAARLIIGACAGVPAAMLEFATGPFGKPRVSAPSSAVPFEFNLSHSGDCVALAVSNAGPVGIDVERHASIPDLLELSEHCFSPVERAALREVREESRSRAFFDGWARKEAYIKAIGVGVSNGLDYFDVELTPGMPARLIADRLAGSDAMTWRMFALDFGAGYSGALVAACGIAPPQQFQLSADIIDSVLSGAVTAR